MEIWKDIEGYEGYYQVSNKGRIKSIDRIIGNKNIKGKVISLTFDKDGYRIVALYMNGRRKSFKVHRLVGKAFLPNKENLPCINHKDQCRDNNDLENLEWCTQKYNVTYSDAIQRRVSVTDYSKLAEKLSFPVSQYNLDGTFVKEWASIRQCKYEGGYFDSIICRCCSGKLKSAYGFMWRYSRETDNKDIKPYNVNYRKIIEQLDLEGNLIETWPNAYIAAKTLGVSQGSISHCITGRNKTGHGYIWRSKEEYL